jgi:hypothetical protein
VFASGIVVEGLVARIIKQHRPVSCTHAGSISWLLDPRRRRCRSESLNLPR